MSNLRLLPNQQNTDLVTFTILANGAAVGKELLAHELTHVVQQGNNIQTKRIIQRQVEITCAIDPIKLARLLGGDKSVALEVLNCCEKGLSPLPGGCTEDVVKAARKLLGKPGKKVSCLPGFRPAQSKAFEGQCCRNEAKFENESDCCPSNKITFDPIFSRCCKKDEDVINNKCVKRPITPPTITCPDDQPPALDGKCCVAPEVNQGGKCVDPTVPPPAPPQPQLTVERISTIGFKKDAPQKWY